MENSKLKKQIEEIRAISKEIQKTGLGEHLCDAISVGVYDAGYRKASDVVDEFVIKLMEMPISCYIPLLGLSTKDEIEEHFNDIMLQVKDAINTVAEELKKKYTEEGK